MSGRIRFHKQQKRRHKLENARQHRHPSKLRRDFQNGEKQPADQQDQRQQRKVFAQQIISPARRQRRDSKFAFQRALMSGGTCEATAFQEFGYQTGAVCVAPGNYHNCEKRGRIAAEYVDLGDVAGMACLLLECARKMKDFGGLVERLPRRLQRLATASRRGLKHG